MAAIHLEGLGEEDTPRLLVRNGVTASQVFPVTPVNGSALRKLAAQEGAPRRCLITLRASVREIDAELLASLTELLRQRSGDMTLTIETVEEGSVRLRIVTTRPGQMRLLQSYLDGEFGELADSRSSP